MDLVLQQVYVKSSQVSAVVRMCITPTGYPVAYMNECVCVCVTRVMYIRPVWKRGAYRVLVEKADGTRCRWEDNTEMELREVGLGAGHGLDRSGSG